MTQLDAMNRPPSTSPAALLAFVRAAELGSFARAAQRLGMSPAAVGQAVGRLERALGVKLLARTTRRMSVTAEGRALLARAAPLLAELGELGRMFDEPRGVVSGPLHVSAPLGFARRHVLPILARFAEAHPAVALTLDASDVVRDLVADRIDVAFRIVRPLEGNLVVVRVARLAPVTLASPAYLRRHGTPRHPDDLAAHACIAYRHPGTDAVEPLRFRVRGRDHTVLPRPRLIVNDVETGCDAGALGLGVVQPPSYYVRRHLAEGTLVPILERHAPAPWSLYLCYAGARHLPRRVRAFIDFARAELAAAEL
jgi:DNA-binding transcriptional LysR family regulator